MKQSRVHAMWVAVFVLVATVSPLFAQSEGGANVNCDSNGVSLQNKIDNASIGATLYISGHCDDGPFVIRKNLGLIGFGSATLSAPIGSNWVVVVEDATVKLSNLNIDADGANTGILFVGASALIPTVVVEDATNVGIDVASSSSVRICCGSEIRNNGNIGIEIRESSNGGVADTTIEGHSVGLNVDMAGSANTANNIINGNDYGIIVTEKSSIFLGGSTITHSINGLTVGTHGLVRTVSPPNTFGSNSGVDVVCGNRGTLEFQDGPQVSTTTGTTDDDGSCLIFGSIF